MILLKELLMTYSDEHMFTIFVIVKDYVEKWMKFNNNFSYNSFPPDFSTDAALEYISEWKNNNIKMIPNINVPWTIKVVAKALAMKRIVQRFISELQDVVTPTIYDLTTETRIEFIEELENSIKGLSESNKITLLYFLYCCDTITAKRLGEVLNNRDFIIVMYKVLSLRKMISMDESTIKLESYLPKTQIGNLIFMSLLISKYPEVTQVLILLKDMKKFLQYIILNEDKEVKVPKLNEIVATLLETSNSVKRIEQGQVITKDIMIFKDLVQNNNNLPEYNLLGNMSEFIQKSFNDILESYKLSETKVLTSVANITPEQVEKLYEVLNNQVVAQLSLMKAVTFLTDDRINNIISKIKDSRIDNDLPLEDPKILELLSNKSANIKTECEESDDGG